MDLIFFLGGIVILAVVMVTWGNWRERRTEYHNYVDHPTPSSTAGPGYYRHFVKIWRQRHRSYLTYCEQKRFPAAPGYRSEPICGSVN